MAILKPSKTAIIWWSLSNK